MPNIAIIDIKKSDRNALNSITVAYRNLFQLRNILNADLFINKKDLNFKKKYDYIICGFGSLSSDINYQQRFIEENKDSKIFWLVGEYEQSIFPALHYAKRDFTIIKNFKHGKKHKYLIDQKFININTLLYQGKSDLSQKKYNTVYYGRWREGRAKYFLEYLQDGVYLSTSSKNMKRFHNNNCNPKYIKPLTWQRSNELLRLFRYSLYVEDVFTHSNYNCLANRFFEALNLNVVQFFDRSCANTINESNLPFNDDFYVSSHNELMEKARPENFNKLYEQQLAWHSYAEMEKNVTISKIRELFL